MNIIQKIIGLLLIGIGIVAEYFLIRYILEGKLVKDEASNLIFAATVIPVSVPIMLGLVLFGYYALKGEYDV